MLRYLAAAFWFRVPVPVLGALPVNLLVLIAILILGFALPPVWLAGLGIEIAYLFSLATNPRFQRLVNSRDAAEAAELEEASLRSALERLAPYSRQRAGALDARVRRVFELYAENKADAFVVENNRSALEKLCTSYVELLHSRETLNSLEDARAAEARIRREADQIEHELVEPSLSPLARDAKTATLATLRRRLEHLGRREASMREIDSYLAQIEAQVDLAVEAAASKGRQEAISAEIDVASFLLDSREPEPVEAWQAQEPRRERQ